MMHKGWKKKWLAALRGGEYKQGIGAMCRIDKGGQKTYCCLGVLTELVMGEGLVKADNRPKRVSWEGDDGGREFYYLPVAVQTKTKLSSHNPGLLSIENDSGKTFSEIADIIEAYL